MEPSNRLAMLFAKPPIPGRVKTRLIGDLSAEGAAALQRAFTADLWRRMQAGRFRSVLVWALGEEESPPPQPRLSWRQRGADLGERLHNALSDALRTAEAAIVVGSDHPDLPLQRFEAAFRCLEAGAHTVLGPSTDGGFYLIGARRDALIPEILAGVRWSSESALRDTLAGIERYGRTVRLLPEGHDVDRPADLRRLADRIGRGEITDCTDTAQTLAALASSPGASALGAEAR